MSDRDDNVRADVHLLLTSFGGIKGRVVWVTTLQALIIASNVAFPIASALLFAVLFAGLDSGVDTALPQPVQALIAHFEPGPLAFMTLAVMMIADASRSYLQFTLQAELDAVSGASYRHLAMQATVAYLNRDYRARTSISSHTLQGLLTRLLFACRALLSGLIGRVVPTIIEALIALGIITAFFGPLYCILFILLIAAFSLFSFLLSKETDSEQRRFQDAFTDTSTKLGDALQSHDQIVSFGGIRRQARDLGGALDALYRSQVVSLRYSRNFSFWQTASVQLFTYAIFALVVTQIMAGDLSIVALVLMTTYVSQFTAPLNSIGYLLRDSVRHLAVLSDIRKIITGQSVWLSTPRSVSEFTHPTPSISTRGLRSVVRTPAQGQEFVLAIDDLEIEGSSDVAIVGANGSGKSSLSRALAGQLVLDAGSVRINDQDIYAITPDERAEYVRYVPQSGQLFRTGLRENLIFPRDSFSNQTLMSILVDIDPSGNLAAQIDSHQQGYQFSGGEVQKVLLARCLINPAPVIIVDEGTSDLDVIATASVKATIRKWCPESLVLYVTHSIDFARSCDKILFLREGRTAYFGPSNGPLHELDAYSQG